MPNIILEICAATFGQDDDINDLNCQYKYSDVTHPYC